MRRVIPAVVAGLLLAAGPVPALVAAHDTASGEISVAADHVEPGGVLIVRGHDLEPGDELTIRLYGRPGVTELGRVVVAADGTIELSAEVPANAPLGYATIIATSQDGSDWHADVLIGTRGEPSEAIDDTVQHGGAAGIGLLMVAVGLVIFGFAAYRYFRRPSGERSTRR